MFGGTQNQAERLQPVNKSVRHTENVLFIIAHDFFVNESICIDPLRDGEKKLDTRRKKRFHEVSF